MTSPETLSGGPLVPEPGDLGSRVLAIGAKILCSAILPTGESSVQTGGAGSYSI